MSRAISMKKNLLFSFTLLTFITNAQTSVYHPFPDSNAVWNIESSFQCWTGIPATVYTYYSLTFGQDTIINSQVYHTLTVPFLLTDSTGCSSAGVTLDVYKGAIRQDTSLKKVFIVPPFNSTEQLLYDFTMQVGDTVKGYLENSAFPTDIV